MNSAESKANRAGWPMRWGPTIESTGSKDPQLRHLIRDDISKWRTWTARQRFTVDSPWEHSPPGFQRHFRDLWQGLPGGSPDRHETDFCQEWDLWRRLLRACETVKAANECIRALVRDLGNVRQGRPEQTCPPVPTAGGNSLRQMPQFDDSITQDDLARIVTFTQLASQRVFAIPLPLTRNDAKAIFAKLAEQVARELPDHRELLGTPEFALLHAYVSQRDLGWVGHEKLLVALPRNDNQPDIAFWRTERAEGFAPDQMRFPAPDFVAEVLSPSTEKNDRGVKFEDYAAHGVEENWLVDPQAEAIEKFTLAAGQFVAAGVFHQGSIANSVVAGFEIPVAAVFRRDGNLRALRHLLA